VDKPTQPFPPNKFSLEYSLLSGATEEHVIYWYRERINEDYDEESYAEMCEDEEYTAPKKSIGQLTLADIIHLVPKGIDYSKVKLVTSWPRMMDWIDYKYIYSVPVDKAAKKAEYNKAMKSFEIAEAKYNKEMVKYEAYCKQVEIDTLEKRLASLKND